MDKIADYVLGKEDGVPKTPKWASTKCGVPPWTIKALAREFAKKVTSIIHYFGGSLIEGRSRMSPAVWNASCSACRDWADPACTSGRSATSACRGPKALKSNRFFNPDMPERLRMPMPDHHLTPGASS